MNSGKIIDQGEMMSASQESIVTSVDTGNPRELAILQTATLFVPFGRMTPKGEKVGPRRRSSDADAVPPFDPHPEALPTAAESASTNPVSAVRWR